MTVLPTESHSEDRGLLDILFEKVESLSDSRHFHQKHADLIRSYRHYEHALAQNGSKAFYTHAFCYYCQRPQALKVDYLYSRTVNGVAIPNWREWLVCSTCKLNNRMRAAYHFVATKARTQDTPRIYVSEESTHLYRKFSDRFEHLTGSEFLGTNVPLGHIDTRKIRNEDATRLTFGDASFDLYLSFDVFEHIPDYTGALQEAFRVLKPEGALIFTVPFHAGSDEHVVRATVNSDGSINYLLPQEFHGDPLRQEGALCYYHFGWQLLRDLGAAGFKESAAYFYLSQRYGYLGGPAMIFCAEK